MAYIVPKFTRYSTGGYDPTDSWSRDSTDGSVSGAELSEHRDYDGFEVEGSGPFYAVVVGYMTGDTFGSDFTACVPFASSDKEEANKWAERVYESGVYNDDRSYYWPWVGYFESLRSVEVYSVGDTYRKVW